MRGALPFWSAATGSRYIDARSCVTLPLIRAEHASIVRVAGQAPLCCQPIGNRRECDLPIRALRSSARSSAGQSDRCACPLIERSPHHFRADHFHSTQLGEDRRKYAVDLGIHRSHLRQQRRPESFIFTDSRFARLASRAIQHANPIASALDCTPSRIGVREPRLFDCLPNDCLWIGQKLHEEHLLSNCKPRRGHRIVCGIGFIANVGSGLEPMTYLHPDSISQNYPPLQRKSCFALVA